MRTRLTEIFFFSCLKILRWIAKSISAKLYYYGTIDMLLKRRSLLKWLGLNYKDKIDILNNPTIKLRTDTSDFSVFEQIIVRKEYYIIVNYFRLNKINPNIIIDCGANIGLTSYFFAKHFPNTRIFSFEPDKDNFNLAKENLESFQLVKVFKMAIWNVSAKLQLTRDFRDGKEWSIQTSAKILNDADIVEAISIKDFIDDNKFTAIDYLKIDIEGAEFKIFEKRENLSFLQFVNLISIEVHHDVGNIDIILNELIYFNFKIIQNGEIIIGIK